MSRVGSRFGARRRSIQLKDDANVRDLVRAALTASVYAVTTAPDGQAAIEAAEHLALLPVVVSDVIMPGMSCGELEESLRARHSQVRILWMSGYFGYSLSESAVLVGTPRLQKPHTPDRLACQTLDG